MSRIIILLAFVSFSSLAKEQCDLKSIGLTKETELIRQLYYTGTCHYRNKDYALSVKSWEKITSLVDVNEENESLKIDVLNNLGFMKFFGYGTETDKYKAIEMWREAILMGHDEAEYHLCHAYGDTKEPTYNAKKAKRHCKKARLIYKGMDRKDDEILANIEKYLRKLGGETDS